MGIKKLARLMLFIAAAASGLGATAPAPSLETLAPRSRELLLSSLHYTDAYWDEAAGLIRAPGPEEPTDVHHVRESSWYALGLLIRNQQGDEARAVRILNQVLANQFDAPGKPWNGTFRRSPEEPLPGPTAEVWKNFDPNWRQFIGTTFALILIDFEPRLPAGMPARLVESMRRAVEGELAHKRLTPSYTNIALMQGFLWTYTGQRLGRPEWIKQGEEWCGKVHDIYVPNESFEEYNSPTYYGVDLYGLALWRRHGITEKIRTQGAEMEAGLWRDIGRFYHAWLMNLCGPFDRSYGMDMRRYVSLVGEWIGLALPAKQTPLPDATVPMDHAHDYLGVLTFVSLGAQIPPDVLTSLREFQGERLLRRPIQGPRIATAWLAPHIMIGGEITGATRPAGPSTHFNQFHPATIHWDTSVHQSPNEGETAGVIGWVRLFAAPAGDAEATPNTLTLTAPAPGDFTFRVSAPGEKAEKLTRDDWNLPGIAVRIDTDATSFATTPGDGFIDLTYRSAKRVVLHTTIQP